MGNKIVFEETQRFKQWWIWVILSAVNGLFLFGVFRQVIGGHPFGDKPMSDSGLLILTVMMLALTIAFLFFKLETFIKEDGIYVRFFPMHLTFKHYTWDQIKKSYVRTYAPLAEFGGWGLRFGLFGKGIAYNVSGNQGLNLEFIDGKKILIGTNKPDEITEALKKIGQLKT